MVEVHEGICRMHDGGSPLTAKILRVRYSCPTLRTDCMEWVMKCEKC